MLVMNSPLTAVILGQTQCHLGGLCTLEEATLLILWKPKLRDFTGGISLIYHGYNIVIYIYIYTLYLITMDVNKMLWDI